MKAVLYVHGKKGNADEANHYKELFKDYEIIGLDYKGQFPDEVKEELINKYNELKDKYEDIILIGNSIGCFYILNAFEDRYNFEKVFFISPIIDLYELLRNWLKIFKVSEEELKEKGQVELPVGLITYECFEYAKNYQIKWNSKTYILYGENDNLMDKYIVDYFARHHNGEMTIMNNGEHWFHTDEQMLFLDNWIKEIQK